MLELTEDFPQRTFCAVPNAVIALHSWRSYVSTPNWDCLCAAGAEDVYRFVGNDTHVDFFRLVLREGNSLLVGGR